MKVVKHKHTFLSRDDEYPAPHHAFKNANKVWIQNKIQKEHAILSYVFFRQRWNINTSFFVFCCCYCCSCAEYNKVIIYYYCSFQLDVILFIYTM